jgi:2-hydroxy-6-oxonona-2,4-dienedioate hydrolase
MKRAMEHILCLQDPEIRPRNLIADDDWRKIKAKVLAIAAPEDREEINTTAMRIRELVPDARTVEMKQVKHWGQFEKPDEFNKISLAFLRED